MSALDWLVPLLRCPLCREPLRFHEDSARSTSAEQGFLQHDGPACLERYPVIDGIPRLLTGTHRARLVRSHERWFAETAERADLARRWQAAPGTVDAVVGSFDDEWKRFRSARTAGLGEVFELYFDLIPPEMFRSSATVLDAGCGAGRWACEVIARGPKVVAVDLGLSVEIARANGKGSERLGCVQLDLRELPLADGSVDWAYSLGVLHHLEVPLSALRRIVAATRSGGVVLVYLYYALDGRGVAFRALFRVVDAVRRVTSRAPRTLAVMFSAAVALFVYWPLARISRALEALGAQQLAAAAPLSFYSRRPLSMMLNDALDRFGTRVELRFTRPAMERLLSAAGLRNIRFSERPPYWHAVADR